MADNFKCKSNKGHCNKWLRECVGRENCGIDSNYDAPCPYCTASSPLDNEQCSTCKYKEWKKENYIE